MIGGLRRHPIASGSEIDRMVDEICARGDNLDLTRRDGPAVLFNGSDPSQIALTFDDGPNEPYTQILLDILAKYGAKGTFFVLGKYVRARPDLVRLIHDGGHAIGNHSETHPFLDQLSSDEVKRELELCQSAIEEAIGFRPTLFRPPYGAGHDTPRVPGIARDMKMETIMWSVIPKDWRPVSAEPIVDRAAEGIDSVQKGHIVVLHDGGPEGFGADRHFTTEAVRVLLQRYTDAGKRFISVPALTRA